MNTKRAIQQETERFATQKELCYTIYARGNNAKSRTKKERAGAWENFGKCAKMRTKKEFLYTIRAGAKNLDFPGKTEFVDTIRAHGKLTKTYAKKSLMTRHARGSIKTFWTP